MKNERTNIVEKTKRLNELMSWFDGDDFSLEKAVDKYAEATKLASEIEESLGQLKNKITEIDNAQGEE